MEYVRTKEQWYSEGINDGYDIAISKMKKQLATLRDGNLSQDYEDAIDDMEYELMVLEHG